MSTVLLVEPDAPTRAMFRRVLTVAGHTVEDFVSAHDARILLDESAFDLAVVDQAAGGVSTLDEVRFVRAQYPRLPLVVTGTMLSARVLLELLRLGVEDALPKPTTPEELRAAVARALRRASAGRDAALEYAAALAAARAALAAGEPALAAPPLARAWRRAPLDAEVCALEALRAELEGRDDDAARGYRAALALRHEESAEGPDPHEGLARLRAYGAARPAPALPLERFGAAPVWVTAGDPALALAAPPPAGVDGGAPRVVAVALGLAPGAPGVHLRCAGDRAFALLATDLRAEHLAPVLRRIGAMGPILADSETAAAGGVDLAQLTSLRDATRPSAAPRASQPSLASRPPPPPSRP